MQKQCKQCKQIKDLACFGRMTKSKDGYQYTCKSCYKQYSKQLWQKPETKIRLYQYTHNPARAEHRKKVRRLYNSRPEIIQKRKEYWQRIKISPTHQVARQQNYLRRRETVEYHYSRYKQNAARRKIIFKLTLEEFKTFWQKPCAYCGTEMKWIGLDRIDSTKTVGYMVGNVVPCCTVCNYMKMAQTRQEFISQCIRIASRHILC